MRENPFKIVAVETSPPPPGPKLRLQELRQKYELAWQADPNRFSSKRSALERERLELCRQMIDRMLLQQKEPLKALRAIDLSCGHGELLEELKSKGLERLHGIDIAPAAVSAFQKQFPDIHCACDAMPRTSLPDKEFDLVFSRDLIGSIDKQDLRLFFSEKARIIKEDGLLFCSTPLDIYSHGPLERFSYYLTTEFEPLEVRLLYENIYIRLDRLLKNSWLRQSDTLYRLLSHSASSNESKKNWSYIAVIAKRRSFF